MANRHLDDPLQMTTTKRGELGLDTIEALIDYRRQHMAEPDFLEWMQGVVDGQREPFAAAVTLPGMEGPPHAAPPGEKVSAARRNTMRQRQRLVAGLHPAAGGPARPDLGTCGGCALFRVYHSGTRDYFKCRTVGFSHSITTDIRKGWPACIAFIDRTKRHPDDADLQ